MPRLTDSVPKYRKHRASGQAIVTLSGTDFYLGPHGTKASRVEYDRLIGEWLAGGRNPLNVRPEEITVVELSARYFRFAKSYYQKDGRCTRVTPAIKCALRYLTEWYGRQTAAEFGPVGLKALRQRMVDDGLSRVYVNDHVGRIKRMFKWAVSEQLVPPSVYEALRAVDGLRKGRTEARETKPVQPVDDATVEATLPLLPPVVLDMVQLQRFTGCRPAEVCILRPCDLDQSDDIWIYRPSSHKTQHHGRERIVVIGSRGQAILSKYLARGPEMYCFRPCDSEAKRLATLHASRKTPLSCGNKPGSNRRQNPQHQPGDHYSTDAYRRAIHRACDKAFPHPDLGRVMKAAFDKEAKAVLREWQSRHRWSPNQLRHSMATTVRKQFGLEAAQVVLGHSSANVTQVYAERDLAKAIEVAREVG